MNLYDLYITCGVSYSKAGCVIHMILIVVSIKASLELKTLTGVFEH